VVFPIARLRMISRYTAGPGQRITDARRCVSRRLCERSEAIQSDATLIAVARPGSLPCARDDGNGSNRITRTETGPIFAGKSADGLRIALKLIRYLA
jgi:hypothetical protein